MKLFRMLFGCRHSNTSRVWSRKVGAKFEYYVVCYSCCKEVPYDWERMRMAA